VIVPGISSFNAANAALKRSVVGGSGRAVMLTSAARDKERIDFLAGNIQAGVTMVFFMVRDLDKFISELNDRLPGNLPAAIVANAGYRSEEQVIVATLDTIVQRVGERKLPAYLLYVGDFLKR
jgi:precorrin-4 methylase